MASSEDNAWLPETKELCSKLAAEEGWTTMKRTDIDTETVKHLFTRIRTERGQAFQFAIFHHETAKKLRGVCQFSDDTNGLQPGLVHAGALVTMQDTAAAALVTNFGAYLYFTAYFNVNFKRPVPVKTAILMESRIDRTEGRKRFVSGYLKSADGEILYSDFKALFIDANAKM